MLQRTHNYQGVIYSIKEIDDLKCSEELKQSILLKIQEIGSGFISKGTRLEPIVYEHPMILKGRLNKKDRILFTRVFREGESKPYLRFLGVTPHDYDIPLITDHPYVINHKLFSPENQTIQDEYFSAIEALQRAEQEENVQGQQQNHYPTYYLPVEFFDDKWIELNEQQKQLMQMILINGMPLIVVGAPGSGKTMLGLKFASMKTKTPQVDFISPSKELRLESGKQFDNSEWKNFLSDKNKDKIRFEDSRTLLERYFSPDKILNEKTHCQQWLLKFKKEFKKLGLLTKKENEEKEINKIFSELKIISGFIYPYKDEDGYLKNNHISLYSENIESKKCLWKVCCDYVDFLVQIGCAHPDFTPIPIDPDKDDVIYVIDEAQQYSLLRIKNLCIKARGRVFVVINPDQNCNDDNVSKLEFIKTTLFNLTDKNVPVYELHNTHRLPTNMVDAANCLLKLIRHLYQGNTALGQQDEISCMITDRNIPGIINWFNPSQVSLDDLKKLTRLPTCAVVTHPEFVEEAREELQTGNVYTSEEIIGLQFPTIIGYKYFSSKQYRVMLEEVNKLISEVTDDIILGNTVSHRTKDRHIKSDAFWGKLYVLCTRASELLLFYDNTPNVLDENVRKITNNLFYLYKFLINHTATEEQYNFENQQVLDEEQLRASWLSAIRKQIAKGHIEQAEHNFIKFVRGTADEFDRLKAENITRVVETILPLNNNKTNEILPKTERKIEKTIGSLPKERERKFEEKIIIKKEISWKEAMRGANEGDQVLIKNYLNNKIDVSSIKNLLCYAIIADQVKIVEVILEKAPDLLDKSIKQNTPPLRLAVKEGKLPIVKFLLDRGANPNEVDTKVTRPKSKNKSSPQVATLIEIAVENLQFPIIECLMEHKIQINDQLLVDFVERVKDEIILKKNPLLKTNLETASRKAYLFILENSANKDHKNILERILNDWNKDFKLDKSVSTFFFGLTKNAAQKGNFKTLQVLLSFDAYKNIIDDINTASANTPADSPLFLAAENGHIDVVALLLKNKVDPNISVDGKSLLHLAIEKNNEKILDLLLKNPKINLDVKDNDGLLPLDYAKKLDRNHLASLISKQKKAPTLEEMNTNSLEELKTKFLRSLKAQDHETINNILNSSSNENNTHLLEATYQIKDLKLKPTVFAATVGDIQLLKVLLPKSLMLKKGDVEKKIEFIQVLTAAINNNNPEDKNRDIVEYLLAIEIVIPDVKGFALTLAVKKGNVQIVKMLIETSTTKKEVSKDALYQALIENKLSMVEFLLKQTDLKNEKDVLDSPLRDNKTPLQLAVQQNKEEMVKFLLCHGVNSHKTKSTMSDLLEIAAKCGNLKIMEMLSEGIEIDNSKLCAYVKLLKIPDSNGQVSAKISISNVILHLTKEGHVNLIKICLRDLNHTVSFEAASIMVIRVLNTTLYATQLSELTKISIVKMLFSFEYINQNVRIQFKNYVINAINTRKYDAEQSLTNQATTFKSDEIIRFFLANGISANPKQLFMNEFMPIHSAASENNIKIATRLIENGANINVTVKGDRLHTPLSLAIKNNRLEIISLLLDQPTLDVNKVIDGTHVLHFALDVAILKPETMIILKMLLAHPKVKRDIKNSDNQTPYEYAKARGCHAEILKLFNTMPSDLMTHKTILMDHNRGFELEIEKRATAYINNFINDKAFDFVSSIYFSHLSSKKLIEMLFLDLFSKLEFVTSVYGSIFQDNDQINRLKEKLLLENAEDKIPNLFRLFPNNLSQLFPEPETLAVITAAQKNILRLYIEDKNTINWIIISAFKFGNIAILNALRELGVTLDFNASLKVGRLTNTYHSCLRKTTPLMIASENGRLEMVQYLLKKGVDPNKKNIKDVSALNLAIQGGHTEVINELLNYGSNIHETYDNTPIIFSAIDHCRPEAVRLLLKRGVDPKIEIKEGPSLLDSAITNNRWEIVDEILSFSDEHKVANFDRSPLINAIQCQSFQTLKVLIEHYEKYQLIIDDVNLTDKDQLLLAAARFGNPEIIKLLLDHQIKSKMAEALNAAISNGPGNLPNVKMLISVAPMEIIEQACLHAYACNEQEALLHCLKTTMVVYPDLRIIHLAVKHNRVDIVQDWVKKNENMDLVDEKGCTALHKAVQFGLVEMVKLLLGSSIDLSTKNKLGQTACELAMARDDEIGEQMLEFFPVSERMKCRPKNQSLKFFDGDDNKEQESKQEKNQEKKQEKPTNARTTNHPHQRNNQKKRGKGNQGNKNKKDNERKNTKRF